MKACAAPPFQPPAPGARSGGPTRVSPSQRLAPARLRQAPAPLIDDPRLRRRRSPAPADRARRVRAAAGRPGSCSSPRSRLSVRVISSPTMPHGYTAADRRRASSPGPWPAAPDARCADRGCGSAGHAAAACRAAYSQPRRRAASEGLRPDDRVAHRRASAAAPLPKVEHLHRLAGGAGLGDHRDAVGRDHDPVGQRHEAEIGVLAVARRPSGAGRPAHRSRRTARRPRPAGVRALVVTSTLPPRLRASALASRPSRAAAASSNT